MNYYVYILQSINYADQIYIGYTTNLKTRIPKHNEGGSKYTSFYKPWELKTQFPLKISPKRWLLKNILKVTLAEHFSGNIYCKLNINCSQIMELRLTNQAK